MRPPPVALLALVVLASSALGGLGALQNLTPVPGRIIVEPGLPSPFPEEITLVFADTYGRVVADITLSASTKTTHFEPGPRVFSGEVRILADGSFYLVLPRGEHRLILRRRPNLRVAQSSSLADYFVKSVQAGSANLLEKPLVVRAAFEGEMVIVLAKCTTETQEECK